MNCKSPLIEKYEKYISVLEDANAQMKKEIRILEKQVDTLNREIVLKDQQITILTENLEQAVSAGQKLAEILDSLREK